MSRDIPPDAASNPSGHLSPDVCLDLLHDLLSPDERESALAHSAECPACEELLRGCFAEKLRSEALAAEMLAKPQGAMPLPRHGRKRFQRALLVAATLGLLGFVLLGLLLPPRSPEALRLLRADGEPVGLQRPLPGEQVLDDTPLIRWVAVPGASRYHLTLESADGAYNWTGTTEDTELRLPPEAALPTEARLRVYLDPVPEYTAPADGLTLIFEKTTLAPFLKYRLRALPRRAAASGAIALISLLVWLCSAVPRLRRT